MSIRFVHVPKTGGQFLRRYFRLPSMNSHLNVCVSGCQNLVVIREPLDRFQSMYRFWRYGSNEYGSFARPEFCSVLDFIEVIKTRSSFYRVHCRPQSYWLPVEAYSSSVVVLYGDDMEKRVREYFPVPDCERPFEPVNVSHGVPVVLSVEEEMWVREYYKVDFELWVKLHDSPSLFKRVV